MENTLNGEKSITILHISVNNRTQELLVAVQGYCMNHILHAILQPQLTHVRLKFSFSFKNTLYQHPLNYRHYYIVIIVSNV